MLPKKTPTPMLTSLASTLPARGREKEVPAVVKSDCAKNPISQTQSTPSLPSSPVRKNISLSPSGKSSLEPRASRLDKRGVGHRHERWAGCGGRFGGARRAAQQADGEVVWS